MNSPEVNYGWQAGHKPPPGIVTSGSLLQPNPTLFGDTRSFLGEEYVTQETAAF